MAIPVISVAQMRAWEQASWQAGRTEADVIHQVGLALARRALQLTAPGEGIILLAGKGHNGDDARAACEHILERRVDLLEVTSPSEDLAELEAALRQQPALIVDGLFGIGLNRPLDAETAAEIVKLFAEVVIAPKVSDAAKAVLLFASCS